MSQIRTGFLVFVAELNKYATERTSDENVVINRPCTSTFFTILVWLDSSNNIKSAKNDEASGWFITMSWSDVLAPAVRAAPQSNTSVLEPLDDYKCGP